MEKKKRDRGFVRVLEVFLAMSIMLVFISNVKSETAPTYVDPHNTFRLHKFSQDLSLSLCGSSNFKLYARNNSLNLSNLQNSLPADVDYNIKLYDRTGATLNETGTIIPVDRAISSTSCVMAGWMNKSNYSQYTYRPMHLVVTTWNK